VIGVPTRILPSSPISGRRLKKERNSKVVAARSYGAVAVREYLRLRPDIVVLDISMGDVRGIILPVGCEIQGVVPRSTFSPYTKTVIT
jgi:hypothetical protein